MEDRHRRLYESFQRSLNFMTANAADFSTVPFVADTVAALETEVNTLTSLGAAKVAKTTDAKSSTLAKGDARDELRSQLEYVCAVWRSMPDDTPGMEQKFRMPRGNNDQSLVAAANGFADEAAKPDVAAIFDTRGMTKTFFNELRAKAAAFAAKTSEADTKRGERVGTNASFHEPIRRAKRQIDKLDPIVKFQYRSNPQKLAEWLVASHVERAPRRRRDPEPKPDPPNPDGNLT